MPVLKYWDGTDWVHVGAGMAWSSGDLKMTMLTTAPEGWLICDGSLVSQATYPSLFTAIGHTANNGNDPGGGNFKLPDLRQRFPMGKAASGAGSTIGDAGGSNDAVAVSHTHPQDAHDHSVTVNNLFGFSGTNSNDTSTNGNHAHAIDGDYGNRIAVTVADGAHRIPTDTGQAGQDVSFTDIDDDGSHAHTLNGHSHSVDHNHTAFSGAATATTQSGGVSGTGMNMPAYQVVNFLIKT